MAFKYLSTCVLFLSLLEGLAMPTASGIRSGPPARCHFRHSVFRQGDAWHSKIQHSGRVYCLTCQCQKEGREQCRSQRCPEACHLSSGCCPLCDSPNDVLLEEGNCIHDGIVYREGEAFASTNGTFAYSAPDQCIQCICKDAIVLCDVLNCSTLSCLERAQMPSRCCPQCAPPIESSDNLETIDVFHPTAFPEEVTKGCLSGGQWHAIGSRWRLGPFGLLPCVECLCNELGEVECHRVLFCHLSESSTSILHPENSHGHHAVSDEALASPATAPEEAEISFRCVSEARQLLAYNSHLGKTNITELFEMAFDQIISSRSRRNL